MFVLHPIEAWINHRSYIYLYISLVLLLKASICVFHQTASGSIVHKIFELVMHWDDQSSLPVLYRSLQTPVANKSLLEVFSGLWIIAEKNGHFVVRGLLNHFVELFWSIPGHFWGISLPRATSDRAWTNRTTNKALSFELWSRWNSGSTRNLRLFRERGRASATTSGGRTTSTTIARSPGPSRGTNEGPAGLPDSSRSSFKSFSVAFG